MCKRFALFFLCLFLCLFLITGCGDTNVIYPPLGPSNYTPTNPTTPNPTPVPTSKIEFRVVGNASGVTVRHSDSINGLMQVTTTLPYLMTYSTSQSSIFLSIEATPQSYNFSVTNPFMVVQIFVNGLLFREASSNNFLLSTLTVSGTWRQ